MHSTRSEPGNTGVEAPELGGDGGGDHSSMSVQWPPSQKVVVLLPTQSDLLSRVDSLTSEVVCRMC